MNYRKLHKLTEEIRMALAAAFVALGPFSRQIQAHKVVFSAYHGAGYGCNPKYVAQALLELDEAWRRQVGESAGSSAPLDMVWLVREHDASMPAAIRQVKWGSVAAAREWALAHVWVDNTRTRRHIKKKPGQFYVQTWHGCLSPKPLEADIEQSLSPTYIKGAKQDSQDADYLICNNDFFEDVMRRAFWYSGPILRCGLPRNAPLINYDESVRERAREQLGVPEGARVCLFAPTFSDSGAVGALPFDYRHCMRVLGERFGGDFIFVLRLHPNVAAQSVQLVRQGMIDASAYPDPVELLCAADVLISDYSSMLEDFALLGRPAVQFVPNIEEFKQVRGLYYPLETRPFPVAYTEEELFNAILMYDEGIWVHKRADFFSSVGLSDDGRGTEAVAQLIWGILHEQEEPPLSVGR